LSPRFKGIEVIRSARAGVHTGECAQPNTINPPRVVVHIGQSSLLRTIDPKRQAAIVCTCACGCPPIELDKV
jgi:hypothetical protein